MSEQGDKPKRKRHWFSFSLKTLLIVMLLLGCGLGWVGMRLAKYRRAKAAVEWVYDNDGVVKYRYEPGPWSKQLFQDDFVDSVVSAKLCDSDISDLTPLANLTSLEVVDLDNTQVSDLTPLTNLRSLDWLYLYNTQVNDLTPLVNLTKLKQLVLYHSQVSRAHVKMLQQALPKCSIHWNPTDH